MKFDPKIVRRATKVLGGGGPATTPAMASALVADLREQSERAIPMVAEVSGLDVTEKITDTPVAVVDRANWAVAATESAEMLLERSGETGGSDAREKLDALAVSGAVAVLSRKILGQFDPYYVPDFVPGQGVRPAPGRLLLVAPNIQEFRDAYDLDRRDLCLWVSVHELTHAAQFAKAPWAIDYISSRVRGFLETESERDIDEIMALMSVLEGHAQYVMNSVPIALMPSQRRIINAMTERRKSGGHLMKKVWELVGMDKKARQYSEGEAFVRGVIEVRGLGAFNRIWDDPLHTPTPEELAHPHLWIGRVL